MDDTASKFSFKVIVFECEPFSFFSLSKSTLRKFQQFMWHMCYVFLIDGSVSQCQIMQSTQIERNLFIQKLKLLLNYE